MYPIFVSNLNKLNNCTNGKNYWYLLSLEQLDYLRGRITQKSHISHRELGPPVSKRCSVFDSVVREVEMKTELASGQWRHATRPINKTGYVTPALPSDTCYVAMPASNAHIVIHIQSVYNMSCSPAKSANNIVDTSLYYIKISIIHTHIYIIHVLHHELQNECVYFCKKFKYYQF